MSTPLDPCATPIIHHGMLFEARKYDSAFFDARVADHHPTSAISSRYSAMIVWSMGCMAALSRLFDAGLRRAAQHMIDQLPQPASRDGANLVAAAVVEEERAVDHHRPAGEDRAAIEALDLVIR